MALFFHEKLFWNSYSLSLIWNMILLLWRQFWNHMLKCDRGNGKSVFLSLLKYNKQTDKQRSCFPSFPRKKSLGICFSKNLSKIIRKLTSYLKVVSAKKKATNYSQAIFLKLSIFLSWCFCLTFHEWRVIHNFFHNFIQGVASQPGEDSFTACNLVIHFPLTHQSNRLQKEAVKLKHT